MTSKERQPPTGPRRVLRQIKVCPDPDCSSLDRPPLASWKGFRLFENANLCAVCRFRLIVLEEIDSATYEDHVKTRVDRPRRMRMCLSCPPFQNTAIYSWKGRYTRAFQNDWDHEWDRCAVDGCYSRLIEFWDIGYAISASRRPSLISRQSDSFQTRVSHDGHHSPRNDDQPTRRTNEDSAEPERPLKRSRTNDELSDVHPEPGSSTHALPKLRTKTMKLNTQTRPQDASPTGQNSKHSQQSLPPKVDSANAAPIVARQENVPQASNMPQQPPNQDLEMESVPARASASDPNPTTDMNCTILSEASTKNHISSSANLTSPHPDLYYDDFGLLRFQPEVMQEVLAKLKESATPLPAEETDNLQTEAVIVMDGTSVIQQGRLEENVAMRDVQAT